MVAAAVTTFAVTTFLQIQRTLYQQLDARLIDNIDGARDFLRTRTGLAGAGGDTAETCPVGGRDVYQIWGASQGQRYVYTDPLTLECRPRQGQNRNEERLPLPREHGVAEVADYLVRNTDINPTRMRVMSSEVRSGGLKWMILVATPVGEAESTVSRTRVSLLVGALLASAIAVVVALLAARRGLRPLDSVQRAAQYVAESEDLGVRLVQRGPDEVRDLAGSMNQMLERIQTSSQRLNTALEEQRRFAQDASHELRTPLTAIRGHVELMQRYDLPEEERATVVAEMGDAADRMKRLVEGLLALARTEGRGGAVEEIALNDILHEVTTSAEEGPFIEEGLTMKVMADAEQIRGVFTNLAQNGRRYGESITIHARADADWAIVEVRDSGPGIAIADRERVFDRFYRAPGLRSTPGSGLGLAIARQAVERAGGTIRLLSSTKGARFEVRLPLAPEGGPPARPPGVLPVGAYEDEEEPPPGVEQVDPGERA